ncbi:hypothetical protein ACFX14_038602 [Malus domestica]
MKEDPTMKTHQAEEKEERLVAKLQKQFMSLQQDWDSYKNSKPKTKRRHSTNYSSKFSMVKNLDQLLDSSPRHLMCSLQHHRVSPSEGGEWKVTSNDWAVEEIRRERRAAIESGRLKGRRLFEAEDCEREMGFGGKEEGTWCGGWSNGLAQESEVRSVSFDGSSDGEDGDDESGKSKEIGVCFQRCSRAKSLGSSSSLADEKLKMEEGVKKVDRNEGGNNGGRCIVMAMRVVAVASIVFGICFIRGFAGYGNENEVILVPT